MTLKKQHTRVQYFILDTVYLMLLIRGRIRATNIPDGATYLRCQYDFLTDGLMFAIEHPDFEEVDEGCQPPRMDLEFDVIDEKGIKVWWKLNGQGELIPADD